MAHWDMKLAQAGATLRQRLVREDDHFILHTQQDNTQQILDDNARLKSVGANSKAHGYIAARIPEILYYIQWPEEFRKKYGYHPKRPPPSVKSKEAEKLWRDFFVAKIHDRDYSKVRTDDRTFK